jgi:hypothetical protein
VNAEQTSKLLMRTPNHRPCGEGRRWRGGKVLEVKLQASEQSNLTKSAGVVALAWMYTEIKATREIPIDEGA